ncbi:MAG: hypothetical protein MUC91_00755 [Verrucomicrobia bacterium]|jgi:hypothetical protein|nr:hypothetical protein [Verrucomicrobiota bacterium]
MALPRTRTNVPRDRVHVVVEVMLMNPAVGEVLCTQQTDHRFTIQPGPGGKMATADRKGPARVRKSLRG